MGEPIAMGPTTLAEVLRAVFVSEDGFRVAVLGDAGLRAAWDACDDPEAMLVLLGETGVDTFAPRAFAGACPQVGVCGKPLTCVDSLGRVRCSACCRALRAAFACPPLAALWQPAGPR